MVLLGRTPFLSLFSMGCVRSHKQGRKYGEHPRRKPKHSLTVSHTLSRRKFDGQRLLLSRSYHRVRSRQSAVDSRWRGPDYAIPIVPIIQSGEQPFSMFDDLKKYPWVLRRLVSYESAGALKSAMQREVVTPALAMSKVIGDMRRTRFERIEVRNVSARKRDQRRK
jgi:hypothetical protein